MLPGNDTHFNNIAEKYEKAFDNWESAHRQFSEYAGPLIKGRTVLDIGNGGFFHYDINDAAQVQVLDISPVMLERIQTPNVRKIVGDARDLSPIPDRSVDVILFSLCLHHIHGRNLKESKRYLGRCIAAAKKKLTDCGRLLVVEPCFLGPWYILESLMFPLIRRALAWRNIPMIFFYSPALLRDTIRVHFRHVTLTEFAYSGWVDPFGGSFPGLIKIPAWLSPGHIVMFDATGPEC